MSMQTSVPGTAADPVHVKAVPPDIDWGKTLLSLGITVASIAAMIMIRNMIDSPDFLRTMRMRAYLAGMEVSRKQRIMWEHFGNVAAKGYENAAL